MWDKIKKFYTDHSKEAHAFAVVVVSLATMYITKDSFRQDVNTQLLANYPRVVAALGTAVVIYRSYASAHSEEARTRLADQSKKEEKR